MLWVWPRLEAARSFQNSHFHRLIPELRGSFLKAKRANDRDLVSILPIIRQRSATTPWKRGANAVETECTHPKAPRKQSENSEVVQAF